MTYSFLPEARWELREATAHYENQRVGLGAEFLHEVQQTIHRILDSPSAYSILDDDIRICRVKRFPYGVLYWSQEEEILIVAVMHLHRRPGYWKKRLSS